MGDDAQHLLAAMKDCQLILAAFVGIPPEPDDAGTFSEFDPEKRELVLTDRSKVPEIAWRTAIQALDLLSIGVGCAGVTPAVESIDEAALQAYLARKGAL
jgi:hypothetical protein